MTVALTMIAALLAQTPYAAAGQDLYAPPVVRPFEPPSDFGRERAQGDDAARVARAPLDAAVTVDAYARSYEVSPSDAEIAYDQGVAQAEINMDARMGPLDGRWRVVDARAGTALMSLVLSDPGGGTVDGAWSWGARTGAVRDSTREGETGLLLDLGPAGRLRLTRTASNAWAGVLLTAEGERTVTLRRP